MSYSDWSLCFPLEGCLTGKKILWRALHHPLASEGLEDMAKEGDKVTIVVDDITRPVPSQEIQKILWKG